MANNTTTITEKTLNMFLFKDYGVTREELNRVLNTVINAIDKGSEIDGVTGDDVYTVQHVLNAVINSNYGMIDEE